MIVFALGEGRDLLEVDIHGMKNKIIGGAYPFCHASESEEELTQPSIVHTIRHIKDNNCQASGKLVV